MSEEDREVLVSIAEWDQDRHLMERGHGSDCTAPTADPGLGSRAAWPGVIGAETAQKKVS